MQFTWKQTTGIKIYMEKLRFAKATSTNKKQQIGRFKSQDLW